MFSKILTWLEKIILSDENKRQYIEDGKYWISGNGFGVNTEHPEFLEGMSKTIAKFDKTFNKGKYMQTLKGSNQEYTKEQVIEAMNMLSDICHSASVRGGWWHDLTTGEPLERNKLEMLCLVHSEVSEACEGVRKGINDDHLPQYRMEDVEIADTFVRCFDYVGGHGLKTAEAFVDKLIYNANRADHKPENRVKEGGKKY